MAIRGIWQGTVADEDGNIVPLANIEITDKNTSALASVFTDRVGGSSKGNPFTADNDGYAFGYLAPGRYKVRAYNNSGFEDIHEDLLIFDELAVHVSRLLYGFENLRLNCVKDGSNNLVFSVLTADGQTPTTSAPLRVAFRSLTQTSGGTDVVEITSAVTLTVPAAGSLGVSNGAVADLYPMLSYTVAQGVQLSVINNINFASLGILTSTTAVSGSATSASTIYTTVAATSAAHINIGMVRITRGTNAWSNSPTAVITTWKPMEAGLAAIARISRADGSFIVGDGSTWVSESGATARTSMGVGTSDSVTFSGVTLSAASPVLKLVETDAAADNQKWRFIPESGVLVGRVLSDDELTTATFWTVGRSGATVTGHNFLGTAIQFNGVAIPTISSTHTLTTKTIALGSNTLSGTIAQFNTALTDADFATLAGSETLSGKTLSSPTLSGTVAGSITASGNWTWTSTAPTRTIIESDASADETTWRERISNGELLYVVLNDALAGEVAWLRVNRTGTTIDTVNFPNGVLQSGGVALPLNSATSTHTCQQLELGHASDTSFTRPAAGRAQIEGREIVTAAADATALAATIAELNLAADDSVTGSFTGTLTGLTTSPTTTVSYVRIGKLVTLSYGTQTGTSNANTLTITGMPASIRPSANINGLICRIENNGTEAFGILNIATDGVMTYSVLTTDPVDSGTNDFDNTGSKGVQSACVSYIA